MTDHPPIPTPEPESDVSSEILLDTLADHDSVEREFTVEQRTQWKTIARRFSRHKPAMVSLVVFFLLVVFAFIGPSLWKYRYDQVLKKPAGANNDWIRPSWEHPFGVQKGYDVLALVMRGTQYSIRIALVVVVLSVTFGVIVGAIAGYFRGAVDNALMRFTDLMLVIPYLAAVAALQRNVQGSTWLYLSFFLAMFAWMGIARVIRGEFLSLREKEFVEAARSVGASAPRIIFRHILPNTVGPIIVNATLAVGAAVLGEAALSFLGLGVKPPDTSLGKIIEVGKGKATTYPNEFWWPVLVLCLISLTINFIGDGLRDAFDPKQNRVRA